MEVVAMVERKRLGRYERPEPADRGPFVMTRRDVEMLAYVARYRFARSDQIIEMTQGSEQQIRRRLLALFQHGYLVRPPSQVGSLYVDRSAVAQPFVYGLSARGAAAVEGYGFEFQNLMWAAKAARAKTTTLAHAIAITETMNAFMKATRPYSEDEGVPHLFDQHELHHVTDAKIPNSIGWHEVPVSYTTMVNGKEVVHTGQVGVFPDRTIVLEQGDARIALALEIDRCTEAIKTNLSRVTIGSKFLGYRGVFAAKKHLELGFERFRIAFVVPSKQRVGNMIDELAKLTDGKGSELFIFSTTQALAEGGPLGDDVWISGKRTSVSLNPKSS
jgi:Replication-relaxation